MKLIQPRDSSCEMVEIASGKFPLDESTVPHFASNAELVKFPNGVPLIRIESGGGRDGAGFGTNWEGFEYIRWKSRQLTSILGVSLGYTSHYPGALDSCYEIGEGKGVQQYGNNHYGWPEVIVKYEQQDWVECEDDESAPKRKTTYSNMRWRWDGESYQLLK